MTKVNGLTWEEYVRGTAEFALGDTHSSGHQFDLPNALDTQVNGNHYKNMAIQPIEFIHANKLGYCEGNVVKYITRWRNKNGKADLEKAKHYIDLLIELEGLNAHLDAQEGVNSPPERP